MPTDQQTPQMIKNAQGRNLSWAGLADWAVTLGLGFTLLRVIWGLGGWPWLGSTQLTMVGLIPALLVLHGICWVASGKIRAGGLQLWAFLPWPVLFLAGLGVWGWSAAPWRGWLEWLPWVYAGVYYWIAVHHLRQHRTYWTITAFLGAAVFLCWMVASLQFYIQPNWLPAGRDTLPGWLPAASGPFGAPAIQAVFLLLLGSLLYLAGAYRRFAGQVRLLFLFLALLAALGVLFCLHPPSAILLGILALGLPWLTVAEWRRRGRRAMWMAGLILLGASLLWLPGSSLIKRWEAVINRTAGEATLAAHERAPVEHPFWGTGLGGLGGFLERGQPLEYTAPYARYTNDWINLRLALGWPGLCLAVGALVIFLARLLQRWVAEPWLVATEENAEMMKISPDSVHPSRPGESKEPKLSRHSRNLMRSTKWGRTPRAKIFTLGAAVGLTSMAVGACWTSVSSVPALLLGGALVAALAVKVLPSATLPLSPRRKVAIAYCFICVTLAGGLFLAGYKRYHAQREYAWAVEELARFKAEPGYLRDVPGRVSAIASGFEAALAIDPGHGDAWADLARLRLLEADLDPFRASGALREAGEAVTAAAQAGACSPSIAWLGVVAAIRQQPVDPPTVENWLVRLEAVAPEATDLAKVREEFEGWKRAGFGGLPPRWEIAYPLHPDPASLGGRRRDLARYESR